MEQQTENKLFVILGKVFLGIVASAVLFSAGYFFRIFQEGKPVTDNTAKVSPTVFVEEKVVPPEAVKTTTESATQAQTLSYKFGNTTYNLLAPKGWKLTQGKEEDYTTLTTVSNGIGDLIIRVNLATEGAPCGFADSPLKPSEMFPDVSSFTYDTYTEFKGSQGQLYRRVDITANPSAGKNFFAVCEKKDSSGWMQPTGFGFVSYEVPYTDNPEKDHADVLKTLDGIFASMKFK